MRTVLAASLGLLALFLAGLGYGLWSFSSSLLYPSWQVEGITTCDQAWRQTWGPDCGNLRQNNTHPFRELKTLTPDGLRLGGWQIDGGEGPYAGWAVLAVHGGGADRREGYRFVEFFTELGMDVVLFDLPCHGESGCAVEGLSFGERESAAALTVYDMVARDHENIVVIGGSVGATSIAMALPTMDPPPRLAVLENGIHSFDRFVHDTPAAPSFLPGWFKSAVGSVARSRGAFVADRSAVEALGEVEGVPILFLHSETDHIVDVGHSRDMHAAYGGPKRLEIFPEGRHSSLWFADQARYANAIRALLPEP